MARVPHRVRLHKRNGSTSLIPVEDGSKYLIRACGLQTPSYPIPGAGLGGLMPRTESNALVGLRFTSADFCDFRAHWPRMRLDDFPTPSRRFFARVSASVATVDNSPGRGWVSRAADNDFSSVLLYPPRSARALQDPWLPRRQSSNRLLSGATRDCLGRARGPDRGRLYFAWLSGAPDDDAVFRPHLHSDAPAFSNSSWEGTPCCRLWLRARRGPSAIFQKSYNPAANPTAAAPTLTDPPVRTVPLPSDHDHAELMGTSVLRLTPSPGDTPTASTRSDALGNAAELR